MMSSSKSQFYGAKPTKLKTVRIFTLARAEAIVLKVLLLLCTSTRAILLFLVLFVIKYYHSQKMRNLGLLDSPQL